MKKNITIIIMCVCNILFAQEKVFELPEAFNKNYFNKNKESFAISNQFNNDLMIFLNEQEVVKTILFDKNFNKKSTINTNRISLYFTNLLGYTISKNRYSLFFTNEKTKSFGVQTFDFDDQTSSFEVIDFKLKKEIFVDSIVHNNEFFIFTLTKKSSILNIYKFGNNFETIKHSFSLNEVEYSKTPGSSIKLKASTLYNGIPNFPDTSTIGALKIESKNPNIIETTSSKIKIYQEDNTVIFSFDNNPDKTNLFFIDLKSLTISHKWYEKVSKDRDIYKRNNSYLFDNKLFQIASSDDIMNFRITDIETDEIIKEYTVYKNDSITFKNSPIIEEKTGKDAFGINIDKSNETEKTKKFLKKISYANLGISVYKIDNLYNIILGGTKDYNPNMGLSIAFAILVSTSLATGTGVLMPSDPTYTNFNPTYYNYNSYSATKSIYINCLFDEEFNHVKGNIPLNSFDKVNNFEDTLKKPLAVTVFRHKGLLHYGYFDKQDKAYKLYKFKE